MLRLSSLVRAYAAKSVRSQGPRLPNLASFVQQSRQLCTKSSQPSKEAARSEETTDFGFQQIPLAEKQQKVSSIFSSVAGKYDHMNDLMSLRVHRLWKKAFVEDMEPTGDMKILDCAGGTGDIAFRIAAHVARRGGEWTERGGITVVDINGDMLNVGRQRAAAETGRGSRKLKFVVGDAQNLPFQDNSFDVYAISFGMRNVPRPDVGLLEAWRVLKPGGRFMMLEFAKVQSEAVRNLYEMWSFGAIPVIGNIVTGEEASYRYLVESIQRFPGQESIVEMMREAGFIATTASDYSFGIACCYSGFKPASAPGAVE